MKISKMKKVSAGMAAVMAGGTMMQSSCTSSDISAIITGVQIAAQVLQDLDGTSSNSDGDINFGDWLLSEID